MALPDSNAQAAATQRSSAAPTAGRLHQSMSVRRATSSVRTEEGDYTMASVIITLKIMPESPDTDLSVLEVAATKHISAFGGEVGRVEKEPIAFGLVALKLIFVMDEKKGSTESLENQIAAVGGVNSVEVTDVRRAIG